jgi:hypothetical protein
VGLPPTTLAPIDILEAPNFGGLIPSSRGGTERVAPILSIGTAFSFSRARSRPTGAAWGCVPKSFDLVRSLAVRLRGDGERFIRFVGDRRGRMCSSDSIPSSSANVMTGTGTRCESSSPSSSSTSFARVQRGAGIGSFELPLSPLSGELGRGGESAMRKIRESGEGTAGAYGFFFNRA